MIMGDDLLARSSGSVLEIAVGVFRLTLNLLTTTIVAPPSNATKWQLGFNSAFKGCMKNQQIHQLFIQFINYVW